MFLSKIYSEPEGLFDAVEFKMGMSFVYAKKDNIADKKKSLNSVGKSLLLNLVDYCLLSTETQHIRSAKKNLDINDYYIVLEFIVDNKHYIIKRSLGTPNQDIYFGEKNSDLYVYNNTTKDKELSKILCDLIFKDENYKGKYSNFWLRKLISFFIKKQTTKSKVNFIDPINYLHNDVKESDLIPMHLLLMGIDNTLAYKNSANCAELRKKVPALSEVESLVQEKYNLKSISQAESEIDKLRSKTASIQKNIDNFKLAEQYKDVEVQSNELTADIKSLLYKNFVNNKKITTYEESFGQSDEINTVKIKRIYSDLNSLLADNIKKTLDEAILFRNRIAESRKKFLTSELSSLKTDIESNKKLISALETERAKLFSFLEAKEAIKDLSEAYSLLNKSKEDMGELEAKIKIYRDLKMEVAEREAESANIYLQIELFAQKIKESLSEFRAVFFKIHDAIYTESAGGADFIFNPNKKKDSKIDMNVVLPSELSYGKNKGRTLIYDLSILMNAIDKKIRCPRFLIHDGIFDGIDKAHFVHLHKYLKQLEDEGVNFQYIVTLNQDGDLKDSDFGEGAEDLTKEKIESESDIILTPSKPLFNKRWK